MYVGLDHSIGIYLNIKECGRTQPKMEHFLRKMPENSVSGAQPKRQKAGSVIGSIVLSIPSIPLRTALDDSIGWH